MKRFILPALAGLIALGWASGPASAYDGSYCREYTQRVIINGRTQTSYGTACMQPDGQWLIRDTKSRYLRPLPGNVVFTERYTAPTYYVIDDRRGYKPPHHRDRYDRDRHDRDRDRYDDRNRYHHPYERDNLIFFGNSY